MNILIVDDDSGSLPGSRAGSRNGAPGVATTSDEAH
jgi:hypothetical protein